MVVALDFFGPVRPESRRGFDCERQAVAVGKTDGPARTRLGASAYAEDVASTRESLAH